MIEGIGATVIGGIIVFFFIEIYKKKESKLPSWSLLNFKNLFRKVGKNNSKGEEIKKTISPAELIISDKMGKLREFAKAVTRNKLEKALQNLEKSKNIDEFVFEITENKVTYVEYSDKAEIKKYINNPENKFSTTGHWYPVSSYDDLSQGQIFFGIDKKNKVYMSKESSILLDSYLIGFQNILKKKKRRKIQISKTIKSSKKSKLFHYLGLVASVLTIVSFIIFVIPFSQKFCQNLKHTSNEEQIQNYYDDLAYGLTLLMDGNIELSKKKFKNIINNYSVLDLRESYYWLFSIYSILNDFENAYNIINKYFSIYNKNLSKQELDLLLLAKFNSVLSNRVIGKSGINIFLNETIEFQSNLISSLKIKALCILEEKDQLKKLILSNKIKTENSLYSKSNQYNIWISLPSQFENSFEVLKLIKNEILYNASGEHFETSSFCDEISISQEQQNHFFHSVKRRSDFQEKFRKNYKISSSHFPEILNLYDYEIVNLGLNIGEINSLKKFFLSENCQYNSILEEMKKYRKQGDIDIFYTPLIKQNKIYVLWGIRSKKNNQDKKNNFEFSTIKLKLIEINNKSFKIKNINFPNGNDVGCFWIKAYPMTYKNGNNEDYLIISSTGAYRKKHIYSFTLANNSLVQLETGNEVNKYNYKGKEILDYLSKNTFVFFLNGNYYIKWFFSYKKTNLSKYNETPNGFVEYKLGIDGTLNKNKVKYFNPSLDYFDSEFDTKNRLKRYLLKYIKEGNNNKEKLSTYLKHNKEQYFRQSVIDFIYTLFPTNLAPEFSILQLTFPRDINLNIQKKIQNFVLLIRRKNNKTELIDIYTKQIDKYGNLLLTR